MQRVLASYRTAPNGKKKGKHPHLHRLARSGFLWLYCVYTRQLAPPSELRTATTRSVRSRSLLLHSVKAWTYVLQLFKLVDVTLLFYKKPPL